MIQKIILRIISTVKVAFKSSSLIHPRLDNYPARTCDAAIANLENVDDITDKYNIEFVKLNNKKYARGIGIR